MTIALDFLSSINSLVSINSTYLVAAVGVAFLAFIIWGVILFGIGLTILLNKGEDLIEEIKWRK